MVDRSSLIFCFWCFYSSTASRHMICWRCFSRHLLFRCFDTTSTPHLSRFTDGSIYAPRAIRLSFSWYLSQLIVVFSPKHSLLSLKSVLKGFFKLHQAFLHEVSFYSLAFHAFMFLKPRFWDFFKKKLGFFKIDEILLKFWVSFEDLILKTSCIALHLHYSSIIIHLDVCNLFVCW